jgi:hypothetical protein
MTARVEPDGLRGARRYVAVLLIGHLVWEIAQLPLYTIWRDGTSGQIAFAVAHCTAGDLLIGMGALFAALLLAGDAQWPRRGFLRVALLAVGIGVAYTVYSEWLNVEVRRAWAYAELMPRLPGLGTGLAPFAQWLVVPALAFRRVSGTRARNAAHVADL